MVRFGLIGAGRIGAVHAATIAAHPGAELALVADPVPGAAAHLAGGFAARSTSDVDDVFAAQDVDAVLVCSPTPYHVDQIVKAVRSGKAVLCEKPVDLSLARVDECIATVGSDAARVMIGFNRRFDPGFAEIKARVEAGEIGTLEQVTIISRDPAGPPAEYLAQSGGIFRDMTIHDFDMARFLVGEIVAVHAVGQHLDRAYDGIDDFDGAAVTLEAASGAVVTIINSRHCAAGYDQRLEAFGSAGSLEADNCRATQVRFNGPGATGASGPYLPFFLQRYAEAYRAELEHFITAIGSGRPPVPSLADGRAALVLADAATLSAQTRTRIALTDLASV